ncbi:MAG TPA: hypothetical protein VGG25_26415 [Streptosporangiaceae bacterium]
MDGNQHWYFCLKHNTVEGDDGCPGKDRLGPYDSREAAANALQKVKERNREWDAQDK